MAEAFAWQDGNLLLQVKANPKSSRDSIDGIHGEAIKISITAPPVDGKANEHLIKFLAKTFGVPKRNIEILSGDTSRHKRFLICSPTKWPELVAPSLGDT